MWASASRSAYFPDAGTNAEATQRLNTAPPSRQNNFVPAATTSSTVFSSSLYSQQQQARFNDDDDDEHEQDAPYPSQVARFPAIRTVLWDRPASLSNTTTTPPLVVGWRSCVPAFVFPPDALSAMASSSAVFWRSSGLPASTSTSTTTTAPASSRTRLGFVSSQHRFVVEYEPPTSIEDPYVFILRPATAARLSPGSLNYYATLSPQSATPDALSTSSEGRGRGNGGPELPDSLIPRSDVSHPISMTIEYNSVRTADDYRTGLGVSSLHITLRLLCPANTFRFTWLPLPPRLADTALATALLTSGLRSAASPIPGLQCGPLTLDALRRAVPLLPSDPACRSTPVVGIWIRAPSVSIEDMESTSNLSAFLGDTGFALRNTVAPAWARTVLRHPAVRAAILWFEDSAELSEKVRVPGAPDTSLVCIFPPFSSSTSSSGSGGNAASMMPRSMTASMPVFFECATQWPRGSVGKSRNYNDYNDNNDDDGWTSMTVLIRTKLRSTSAGVYEPLVLASPSTSSLTTSCDIGRVVSEDDGTLRWSLRALAPHIGRSAKEFIAQSRRAYGGAGLINTDNNDENDVYSHGTRERNAGDGGSGHHQRRRGSTMKQRDFTDSRLPVFNGGRNNKSANTSVVETNGAGEMNTSGMTTRTQIVVPSSSSSSSSSSSASPTSPSRIPVPKFPARSPRSHRREAAATAAATTSQTTSADISPEGVTRRTETYNATQENDNQDSDDFATANANVHSNNLEAFKLSPADHKQLQGITRDLDKLSSLLHGHLQPSVVTSSTPSVSGTLFPDSTRASLAKRRQEREADEAKMAVSRPPNYSAANQIAYISASLQSLQSNLTRTLEEHEEYRASVTSTQQQTPQHQQQSATSSAKGSPSTSSSSSATTLPHPISPASTSVLKTSQHQATPQASTTPSTYNNNRSTPVTGVNTFTDGLSRRAGGGGNAATPAGEEEDISEVAARTARKIQLGMSVPKTMRTAVSYAVAATLPLSTTEQSKYLPFSASTPTEPVDGDSYYHHTHRGASPAASWLSGLDNLPRATSTTGFFDLVAPRTEAILRASMEQNNNGSSSSSSSSSNTNTGGVGAGGGGEGGVTSTTRPFSTLSSVTSSPSTAHAYNSARHVQLTPSAIAAATAAAETLFNPPSSFTASVTNPYYSANFSRGASPSITTQQQQRFSSTSSSRAASPAGGNADNDDVKRWLPEQWGSASSNNTTPASSFVVSSNVPRRYNNNDAAFATTANATSTTTTPSSFSSASNSRVGSSEKVRSSFTPTDADGVTADQLREATLLTRTEKMRQH